MKFSKEIKESKQLCDEIAKDISKHIFDFVFKEALEIVESSFSGEKLNEMVLNPMILVLRNINSGNIYVDVHGNLSVKKGNAKLSKAIKMLGGKWDNKKKTYKIDLKKYPNIAEVQAIRADQVRQNLKRMDELLILKKRQIEEKEAWHIPDNKIDAVISDLMEKSLVAIPEPPKEGEEAKLGIVKKVNEKTLEQFREEYLDDTRYPIKDMESRAVERIRKRMLKLTMEEGLRQEEIAEVLMKEFGESERHALFLARQEAKLIKAKIARDRALNLGYTDYIWQTNIDGRERTLHRELNGSRCSFLSPPIIDEIGTRGNPGEAFGCRCLARIITDE